MCSCWAPGILEDHHARRLHGQSRILREEEIGPFDDVVVAKHFLVHLQYYDEAKNLMAIVCRKREPVVCLGWQIAINIQNMSIFDKLIDTARNINK